MDFSKTRCLSLEVDGQFSFLFFSLPFFFFFPLLSISIFGFSECGIETMRNEWLDSCVSCIYGVNWVGIFGCFIFLFSVLAFFLTLFLSFLFSVPSSSFSSWYSMKSEYYRSVCFLFLEFGFVDMIYLHTFTFEPYLYMYLLTLLWDIYIYILLLHISRYKMTNLHIHPSIDGIPLDCPKGNLGLTSRLDLHIHIWVGIFVPGFSLLTQYNNEECNQ